MSQDSEVLSFLKGRDWMLTVEVARGLGWARYKTKKVLERLEAEGYVQRRHIGKYANMWRLTRVWEELGKRDVEARVTGVLTCPFCKGETRDYDILRMIYRCDSCGAFYTYLADLDEPFEKAEVRAVRVGRVYAVFWLPWRRSEK